MEIRDLFKWLVGENVATLEWNLTGGLGFTSSTMGKPPRISINVRKPPRIPINVQKTSKNPNQCSKNLQESQSMFEKPPRIPINVRKTSKNPKKRLSKSPQQSADHDSPKSYYQNLHLFGKQIRAEFISYHASRSISLLLMNDFDLATSPPRTQLAFLCYHFQRSLFLSLLPPRRARLIQII
jgi:hypothetical protein